MLAHVYMQGMCVFMPVHKCVYNNNRSVIMQYSTLWFWHYGQFHTQCEYSFLVIDRDEVKIYIVSFAFLLGSSVFANCND